MSEEMFGGPKPVYREINKTDLTVDERYQRSIEGKRSQALIFRIQASFSWSKFGILRVADNGDGTLSIVDGQHRHAAVMTLDRVTSVPCLVDGALSLKEQAAAFVGLNDRVAMTALALFHAKVRGGDEKACEVERVVKAAGCRVPRYQLALAQQKQGDVVCIGAVRSSLVQYGEKTTIAALRCVREAWVDAGGVRKEILAATGLLMSRGRTAEGLLRALRYRRPESMIAAALSRRADNPVFGIQKYVADLLLETMNLARVA
jgi:hypothetical protein